MFLLVLLGLILVIICIQQAFPKHSLLPFALVNGSLTRITSKDSVLRPHKTTEDKKINLKVAGKSYAYRTGDLGISLNEDATLRPYYVESRLKRLIPFSMLAQAYSKQTPYYDSSQKGLNIVTSSIADGINQDPVNAGIHIDQSSVTIISSKLGRKFEPKKATIAIFDAITSQQNSVELASEELQPDITTAELEKAVAKFTSGLPDELAVKVSSQSILLSKQSMLSWLTFTAINSQPVIGFDDIKVQAYAEEIATNFRSSSPPTATIVALTDGKETGRIAGSPGKSIIGANLKSRINIALSIGSKEVLAELVDVPSPIKYTRSYTRSSEGLKDLLGQITAGKNIAIRYIDVNDRGWDVGSKEHEKMTMASTYKLFVGYEVLKRVDAGTLKLSDSINGTSFDVCMSRMIVNSDNECAIAMGERLGWNNIVASAKAIGASDLDWVDDAHGSVSDCATLLRKLASGEVLTQSSRDYYIGLMRSQVYRKGIPAGTSYEVANKVGFLGPQLNDAGIIFAPDMTHVLVIYTNGESWDTIAEITRQIEALVI